MTHTLLEIVQSISSSLNSDEVNSIGDSPESLQIAECVKTSYLNMLGRYDLPEHNQFINLASTNNPSQPTLMLKPPGVNRIEWVQYYDSNVLDSASTQTSQYGSYSHDLNLDIVVTQPWTTTSTSTVTIGLGPVNFTVASSLLPVRIGQGVQAFANSTHFMNGYVLSYSGTTLGIQVTSLAGSGVFTSWNITGAGGPLQPPGYMDIEMVDVHWFMNWTNTFNLGDQNVGSYQLTIDQNTTGLPNTFTIKYENDHQPRCCCVIASQYILFDSYDNTQDTILQPAKSLAYAWVMPPWQMNDDFIPPLDDQQYPMLLNEAKSLAWLELKQVPHSKAETEVMRQLASLQKYKALGHKPAPFDYLPNFGRIPNTGGYAIFRPR